MKVISYNQRNGGHRKVLCTGAPQGPARYQSCRCSALLSVEPQVPCMEVAVVGGLAGILSGKSEGAELPPTPCEVCFVKAAARQRENGQRQRELLRSVLLYSPCKIIINIL